MKIYVVIKNEMWDGETWDMVYGARYTKENARELLKAKRAELYQDWENDEIDEDSEDAFYAYRDGCYSEFHVNLYIEETELQ